MGSRPSSMAFHRSRLDCSAGSAAGWPPAGCRPTSRSARRTCCPSPASPAPSRTARAVATSEPSARRRGEPDTTRCGRRCPRGPTSARSWRSELTDDDQPVTTVTRMPTEASPPRTATTAAHAAPGDQHDAPAGQHDQGQRACGRDLAGLVGQRHPGEPVGRLAVAVGPRAVAGHRGQPGGGEAEQHDRAEGTAAWVSHRGSPGAGRRRSRCGRRCGRRRPPGRP